MAFTIVNMHDHRGIAFDPCHMQIHVSAPPGCQIAQAPMGRHQHQPQRMQPKLQIADCAHNGGHETELGAMLRNPSATNMGGKSGSRHPDLASLLAGPHAQRNGGGTRLSAGSSRTNASRGQVLPVMA